MHGAGDDAVVAERLRHEGAGQAVDVEIVQVAGDVELLHLLNGGGAGEAAAERGQTDAGELDAVRVGGDGGIERDAGDAGRALVEADVAARRRWR